MARPSNQDHVARTLRALAILRSEPGWHHVARLALLVEAKPVRLGDDLRRCCYVAEDWHLPLFFGSDVEPPHPDGDNVVQLAADVPITLALPSSRVELIRLSLLADAAARRHPDHPRSLVLSTLHLRLTALLDSDDLEHVSPEPPMAAAIRAAIADHRNIRFSYRSLTASSPSERLVTPLNIHRQGRWWMLDATSDTTSGQVNYRLDRIVGDVNDAGPVDGHPALRTTIGSEPTPTTAVRLRLHGNDLWTVDDLAPTDLEHRADDRVDVTINLYPPVGERLSRVLFLADPATTELISGHTFLDAHRRSLRHHQERQNRP